MAAELGVQVEELDDAAQVIRDLDVTITFSHVDWGVIEPRVGHSDLAKFAGWDRIRSELGGSLPRRVYTLYPIHMNERGAMPAEVKNLAFDDPALRGAFEAYVCRLAEQVWAADTQPIAVVGNEVDTFVGFHPDEHEAAVEFLRWSTGMIHRAAPHALVCHTVTGSALTDPRHERLVTDLVEASDVISFTSYGIDTARYDAAPAPIAERLATVGTIDPSKKLLLAEVGRPSSETCGSSEEYEAEYVDELFAAAAGSDRLLGAIWLTTRDWPVDAMRDWVHNQFPIYDGHAAFLAFLTSMGLCDLGGRPKAAYRRWRDLVQHRN